MTTEELSTRRSGSDNTLKGVAITVVLINHYLIMNVTANSAGFANAWIAVFFILSGYGIFHSLERRFSESINKNNLLLFFYHRLIRIFPLLWIAWLIELAVRGNNVSFWVPLGIHGSDHYWFIPALLQCYLLSPLIFLSMKTRPVITFVVVTILLVITNYLILNDHLHQSMITLSNFINADWRGGYFVYILMFTAGMALPAILRKTTSKPKKTRHIYNVWFWVFFFSITLGMVFLKQAATNSLLQPWLFNLTPLFPIALLCLYALAFPVRSRCFEYLGKLSYALYLFHMSYYHLISDKGDFPKNSLSELLWFLLFLPFFIYMCQYFDRLGNRINTKLKNASLAEKIYRK